MLYMPHTGPELSFEGCTIMGPILQMGKRRCRVPMVAELRSSWAESRAQAEHTVGAFTLTRVSTHTGDATGQEMSQRSLPAGFYLHFLTPRPLGYMGGQIAHTELGRGSVTPCTRNPFPCSARKRGPGQTDHA